MRKYHHLLSLRGSKGVLISNPIWVHRIRPVGSDHFRHHPQPLPPPLLPLLSSPSSYPQFSRNKCSRDAIVSQYCLHQICPVESDHLRHHPPPPPLPPLESPSSYPQFSRNTCNRDATVSQYRLHRISRVESDHLHHHPQPPPPPLLRPLASPPSYPQFSRNTCSRNAIVSQYCLQATPSCNHYHSRFSTLHTSELPYHDDEDSPLDYKVTVKDREFISAAGTPGNEHWLPLSNLDLLLPPVEAGVFFCYKKKDDTNISPEMVVKTIKKSMAGILPSFYPLAGEIVQNSQGEPEVLCNNNGVEFVHAHADVELKDLDFYHPDASVKGKLVPKINRGVFSIQATELNCGAIIISCAFKHQIADGYSLSMFLVAWAKYTKFGTISNIPSFRTSILNPRHPPQYDLSIDSLYIPASMLPPPSSFHEPLRSRMYSISASSIERLQSEASTEGTKRSKLVSFTAYLWKLLAHGGDNEDVNSTSRMGIVVNGRRFLTESSEKGSTSLFENHFGNVLSIPYGLASNNDLKGMPLHEVANGVRKFVAEAANDEHFRGLIDWVELHRPKPAVARIYFGLEKSEGEATVVSSGQGLPINDMDFGWGKPEFGSYHFPWGSRSGYITTMPSASKDGDWIVYMHLKEKDFNLIERMAPRVFTPLTNSYTRL